MAGLELSWEQKLRLLEAAAANLDLDVRQERLTDWDDLPRPGGGLIRFKGRWRVILDKGWPTEEKVRRLAQALARRGALEGYLTPAVRDLVANLGPDRERGEEEDGS